MPQRRQSSRPERSSHSGARQATGRGKPKSTQTSGAYDATWWTEVEREVGASTLTPDVTRHKALLACEEFRELAWHLECNRRRQKDQQLDEPSDGCSPAVAAEHRSNLATSGLFGPPFWPVRLVQQLYQVGELRSAAGYRHLRRLVTDEHRRFFDDLARLTQVRNHLAHDRQFAFLMEHVIGEFEEARERTLAWWPPRSAFPRGGGRPGIAAVAFRWIANFIPHDYATPDTKKHRGIVESLAEALGIEYDAGTYDGISRTGWEWPTADSENSG